MIKTLRMLGAAALLAFSAAPALAASPAEPALSKAQSAVVAKAVSALKHPEERQMVAGWTNAKKVAEMICRPIVLPTLEKQAPGADRAFLGTNDPATLTLVSNKRLTGIGQVRVGAGWRDFTFTCQLNPRTGKATSFKAVMKPAA